MPAKAKSNSATTEVATFASMFEYVDADGVTQKIDPAKVQNLGDTRYAASCKLFPFATPCMIDQDGVAFDEEGRQNVINQNLIILSARRMIKGEYGPWLLVQCAHPELGEITVIAPGQICNDAIANMAGIDLKTGESTGWSELPVWARFEFVPDAGQYKRGYFVILPAIMQGDDESDPSTGSGQDSDDS